MSENVVANGDERWLAWVASNGWDHCACCDLRGYHQFGDNWLQCAECDGFGFTIPEDD